MRAAIASVLVCLCVCAEAGAGADERGPLSGAWLFGDGLAEPREAVVSVAPRCWRGGVDFTLVDLGAKLTGQARWIEAIGGMPPTVERDETETLAGTREGDRISLTGRHRVVETKLAYPSIPGGRALTPTVTTVRYDLRLDPRTKHLIGTRDGRPFWLARFRVRRGECGSPPP
jgi:hypothetical protein